MAIDWSARQDLLNSPAQATHFVFEIEHGATAYLRFGDDRHAKRPDPATVFSVHGRIGNGAFGNVPPSAIAHIKSDSPAIVAVRNPLPARGGVEPETVESVRLGAPYAFRTQERAVTTDDYRELTGRRPEVQRAAATFRWTGSWHTAFVTVDRRGGAAVDAGFASDIRGYLERYRMAGGDLEVNAPSFVPLEIEMQVCVGPYYLRSHVREELLRVFSNGYQRDGRPALFHPDRFTFGTTVYLSPLYAAAQSIEGVTSVHIVRFQRQGRPDPQPLADGRLTIGRLEIARLDNDPNFQDRGVFRLQMGGGR
jgi:predicted phage baseplate assembly protein